MQMPQHCTVQRTAINQIFRLTGEKESVLANIIYMLDNGGKRGRESGCWWIGKKNPPFSAGFRKKKEENSLKKSELQ